MRTGKTQEEALLESIKTLAEKRGVDPAAIQSIFDLFKAGIDILTMDPGLADGKIDGSYFTLIEQLSDLTGISQGKIIGAFRKGLGIKEVKITQGDIIEGSDLWKEAERLKEYNKEHDSNYNLSESPRKLYDSDFSEGRDNLNRYTAYVSKGNDNHEHTRYLSALDVVSKDAKSVISTLLKSPVKPILEAKTPAGVIYHIEDYITFREDGTFSYKPGIETILRQMDKEKNIKIAFIVPESQEAKAEIALKATGRFGTNILIAKDATDAKIKINLPADNIVYVTHDEHTAQKAEFSKTIIISPESAFHASLTLAVLYARAGPKMINDKLNPEVSRLVWHFLKLMDYKDEEIRETIAKLETEGFLAVKLIRIKDTLEEFQNRKIYIETAA
jgi:hypothetical protein